jgi:hypothetical protein
VCSGFCVGSLGGVGYSWGTWCVAKGKESGGGAGKEPNLGPEKY